MAYLVSFTKADDRCKNRRHTPGPWVRFFKIIWETSMMNEKAQVAKDKVFSSF